MSAITGNETQCVIERLFVRCPNDVTQVLASHRGDETGSLWPVCDKHATYLHALDQYGALDLKLVRRV